MENEEKQKQRLDKNESPGSMVALGGSEKKSCCHEVSRIVVARDQVHRNARLA